MRFGVHLRPTDETIDVRDLAPRVEDLGFESYWVSEHSHVPVRMASQWPGGEGMPRFMSRFLDPFLAVTRAATVTERLRFGTGIVLAPQRDTIQLAKEVSTLDFLSGGRFIFGIGAGWNLEEMRNHGVHPPDRWRKMREQTLAMKAIWTSDEAQFHGDLVDFNPIQMWPKPIQQPHPPVLIGGEGPTVLQRVLDYGDGWLPNDHPRLPERAAELRRLTSDAGREELPITAFAVAPNPARIEQLISAGVERIVFNLPDGTPADVLAALDRLARIARPYS
jgi:probable F420-dependent oxidoreductase